MTVEVDMDRKRAFHVQSGLTVEWVCDEPSQERKSHFLVIFEGKEMPFEATFDFGEEKFLEKRPDATPEALSHFLSENLHKNYRAQNISGDFDRDIFVEVWRLAISPKSDVYRYSAFYVEWTKNDMSDARQWSSEG